MIFAWCPEGDPLLSQSVATCMIAGAAPFAATHSILNLRRPLGGVIWAASTTTGMNRFRVNQFIKEERGRAVTLWYMRQLWIFSSASIHIHKYLKFWKYIPENYWKYHRR